MAIADRIGYYTVFEDGHIVKGKDWYPLVTESDFLNQEIKLDVNQFVNEPKPIAVIDERNIWGSVIGQHFEYDEDEMARYKSALSAVYCAQKEVNETRKAELEKFIDYRRKQLKKVSKAYFVQEKKKKLEEKKSDKLYSDRLKKRIKEYRAYVATQPKTINILGVKMTYTPKRKEPRVVQKRTFKILGRQIEIER